MKTKMHKRTKVNRSKTDRRSEAKTPAVGVGPKPTVVIVPMENGEVRIVNVSAAARWTGVSSQMFGRVIRAYMRNIRSPKTTYMRVRDRVMATYPELFAKQDARRS